MTPEIEKAKIKAKEIAQILVSKYGFCLKNDDKKAALICVDEILKVIGDPMFSEYEVWTEVKSEIEKL